MKNILSFLRSINLSSTAYCVVNSQSKNRDRTVNNILKSTKQLKSIMFLFSLLSVGLIAQLGNAQIIERGRPTEWENLVYGGRFMDRFSPIPPIGELSDGHWGAPGVKSRYTDNGIEDDEWSYWGGNIIKDSEGKFHQFVCRWREDSEKGHWEWPRSEVVHAISDNSMGPFKVIEVIGKGHNPEIHQLNDGKYFLNVNNGYYLATSLNGPWEYNKLTYDQRERPIIDHLTNFTFAQREDGSYLMLYRGGGIWFSQTGLPPYYQVSEESTFPAYEGRYEDPVVWRTNIQYHMIVNDWLGRIAYYLRSKDGINWKVDPGEAYAPGIARHEDGKLEDWYKFERIKVLQDEYGRAYQANFAVIDTKKNMDLSGDTHSSKNICIPLIKGRLVTLLNPEKITEESKTMRVLVRAEPGFDPQKDMNFKSLRFGASEEVNYGRGSKLIKKEKSGDDLVLYFNALGNGLTDENFVAKLLGKKKDGTLLFAYARLPWLDYNQQHLSPKLPVLSLNGSSLKIETEVQNFGQVSSNPSQLMIEYKKDNSWILLVKGIVPTLLPFVKTTVVLDSSKFADRDTTVRVRASVLQEQQNPVVFEGNIVIR